MNKKTEQILLKSRSSLITASFWKVAQYRQQTQKRYLVQYVDLLRGKRAIRYPLISLTTQREMGPYRHVLSQKVVAGTMAIHPPYVTQVTQTNKQNTRTKFWRK